MPVESRDPSNDDSLLGTFNIVLRKILQSSDTMLPATVVIYDRETNRVTVQPQVQIIDTDGNRINRAQRSNLPVLLMGGGNFLMSFNLPAGSMGWMVANDRDISLFLQEYSIQPPNTMRIKNFDDAVFIPDVMTGYTIAKEDEQAAVIQNLNGTVKLSLTDQRIKLTAPEIEVMGNLTVNGTTDLTGNTTITGNSEITGTLTNGLVNMTTHFHVSSASGSPSGPPTNTAP